MQSLRDDSRGLPCSDRPDHERFPMAVFRDSYRYPLRHLGFCVHRQLSVKRFHEAPVQRQKL